MGQPVAVIEKPTTRPGIVRFETNRVLTGMDHLRYRIGDPIIGNRPPDELARRLFERGGIDALHIYSNVVTVDLAKGATTEGLADIIRGLHTYYVPGVEPPSFDEGEPAQAEASEAGETRTGSETAEASGAS